MLRLEKGSLGYFDFYYRLKCEASAVYWGGYEKAPLREALYRHYRKLLHVDGEDFADRDIFFLIHDGEPAGYLQITRDRQDSAEMAMGISESCRGKGFGKKIVELGVEYLRGQLGEKAPIFAWIREDNRASLQCFESNGFSRTRQYKECSFPGKEGRNVKMYLYEYKCAQRAQIGAGYGDRA